MQVSSKAGGFSEPVQVVLNSYGREAWYVDRAVASFLRQKHPPDRIHVIDQNETPLALDPALVGDPRVAVHHRPGRVGARARNAALELVREGWIAFADDDAHWREDYSEKLREVLAREPGLGLIAGAIIDESTGDYYSVRHRLGGNLERFPGSKLLAGANFLVRAERFAAVGGYDPRLGPGTDLPSSEEADLCWRLLAAGTRARYVRELAALHPPMHVADARDAARKGHRYGLGKGALAAIWIFERHHRFGLLEFLEMSVVPFLNLARGVLRGDFAQLRIQPAILLGRHRGFWSFVLRRPRS